MELGRRTAAGLAALAVAATLAACSSSPATPPYAPVSPTGASATPGPATPAPGSSSPAGPSAPTEPSETSSASPDNTSPENFPDADRLAFPEPTTDLPTITVAKLPAQAVATLRVIKDGGPFPYPQDGMIFQNREGELPEQPAGFYHEFTVATPGSDDRGPRRIVSGADGSLFWTTNHYRSFREIIEPWT